MSTVLYSQTLKELAEFIHENARSKGFWDEGRNLGEAIALMHSELSEALEALREGNMPSDHIPEFSGAEEELADVIIRILDFSEGMGLDVPSAVMAKMEFNRGRPHKHGKLF